MKKILIIVMTLCVSTLHAQVTPRNILAKKYSQEQVKQALVPREQYKPYPTTPQEWKAAVPDSVLTRIVKAGQEQLTYTFEPITASTALDFVRSGDRERHSGISFGKRNAMVDLMLAESVEGKGRFTEAILNGVWSICEESFWGVPAHIGNTGLPDVENPVVDLFAAETAAVLGLADYFVGDQLDKINPLVRKRIYFETNRRLFTPMLTKGDTYGWNSPTRPVNNWNPWIMSNWISATLMLEKDEDRRAAMIHKSMTDLDRYLNSLGDDGGCDEGPSYWTAAGASVYDCLELLSDATNRTVNLYDEPLIQNMGGYFYKVHIDEHYFVNFADADPKLMPDGLLLYRFGKALNDERMVEMGQWALGKYAQSSLAPSRFHRFRFIKNLLTAQHIGPTKSSYKKVEDAWLSDIQVLTARSSNGLFLATHGGHNAESHNHNDVGDFMLYANGEPVIIDAGRGNYTARTFSNQRYELWFTQSQYHNLPIINGLGQLAGRNFEAQNVSSRISDKDASLTMNIAPAYPPAAGLTNWNRKVTLNRAKNQVEVTDEFTMQQKPSSLQEVFMTIADVDTTKPGLVKLTTPGRQTFVLRYDPKEWKVSTDYPSTDGMEYRSFKTKWDNRPVQRILLSNISLSQKGKHSFTIAPYTPN
ncbi:heparinase II/III family protein [Telluribacter sp. SYSU D00476]|uniref:heparinase II/III domain-containing protein n=1 Tax=Telluribacter sp. SYSU D00476 TaxID=2811430 RepID=UPI001FF1FC71|nr:heparinase II/III family protein [Telluribacter sp. SYSU D00476]